MVKVEVQKAPTSKNGQYKRELYASICFYYPKYDLKDIDKMPARDLSLLLRTAHKIEASRFYNLTQIAAAPHSRKGESIKKLLRHYEKVMNNER